MTIALGRLAEVNPAVPEFDNVEPNAQITFMPLEACWPDGNADTTRRASKASVASGYTRFRNGDVLLPKITPTFEAGRVFATNLKTDVGAATTEVHVLRARSAVDPRFLAYVARSQPFLQLGASSLQGVGNLRRVTPEFVRTFRVPKLSFHQQAAIADYLDLETAQIDTLIAKQEQLIATLRERRTTMHALAVTRGLRDSPLKSSGVAWLGDVPTHWNTRPLWSMFDRIKDVGHPGEQMLSVFRDFGVVAKDDHANLNQTAENRDIYQLVHPGWLVCNRMKAWQGSVGISGLRGIVSGHYICFAPTHDADDGFLNWLFRSRNYAAGYGSISRGVRVGQAEIDNDLYRLIPVLLPPPDEQVEIAAFLDERSAAIDLLITKAERFIELSKERRAALITAAVTGQIEIPA